MDARQPTGQGFSAHLQEQLNQASQQVQQNNQQSPRGRGRNSHRSRGGRSQSSHMHQSNGQFHPQQPLPFHLRGGPQRGFNHREPSHIVPPVAQSHKSSHAYSEFSAGPPGLSMTSAPADMQSFPPLGSGPPPGLKRHRQPRTQGNLPPIGSPQGDVAQSMLPTFFERNRGRGSRHHHHNRPHPHVLHSGDFQRPQSYQSDLYNPGVQSVYENPQKTYRETVMRQSDYLNHVSTAAVQCRISNEELTEKELFRKELEAIARSVISGSKQKPLQLDHQSVVLKCYGSLANGFALQGSDMDLLLMFPGDQGSFGDIEIESRRMLEKALLDHGIGARLLTNTRVPILRVCQKPRAELLENLRQNRKKWEESELNPPSSDVEIDESLSNRLPMLSAEQVQTAARAMAELNDAPADIPLPLSPQQQQASLEYSGDCGIQCDINFSNFVAIHNTRLLKYYCSLDARVKEMGLFVKAWAKARDINTPYYGTLSSYGYILMVIHYLINVANPPILPNLQHMAREEDAWKNKTDIKLFDGFDIRFTTDEQRIAETRQSIPRNKESLGSLLRGFFWYFGHGQGFHWTQSVISIRTKGGILKKFQKGWTEAKHAEGSKNIRLRYLLCIEDPFETEHNIARTVGHNGLVAIRDEFRRGWKIIERVERTPEGWQWQDDDYELGEELLEKVVNRGDTLRKDQEFHRQKLRQMREALEAKQKMTEIESSQEGSQNEGQEVFNNQSEPIDPSKPKLTPNFGNFRIVTENRRTESANSELVSESNGELENVETYESKSLKQTTSSKTALALQTCGHRGLIRG